MGRIKGFEFTDFFPFQKISRKQTFIHKNSIIVLWAAKNRYPIDFVAN